MMSIKKIGALALTLIIATGFLNLDAGRMPGGVRYPASDLRSRKEIGLERRETAKSVSAVVNGIRNILYNDDLDAATKMRLIREQASLFGKSEEQIRQMAARKDAEAAAKVRAFEEATKELERKQAAVNANPENVQAQKELVQANAGWSRAQKAMLTAAGAAVLFGGTYLASRYVKPGEESWEITRRFADFAPAVDSAFKNMSQTTKDLLGFGEGESAWGRLRGWWSGTEADAAGTNVGENASPAASGGMFSRWFGGSKAANPPAAEMTAQQIAARDAAAAAATQPAAQ